MTKFSSNRPVKSTLRAGQSLVKRAKDFVETRPSCLNKDRLYHDKQAADWCRDFTVTHVDRVVPVSPAVVSHLIS